jgi:hypothetical protein
MGRSNMSYSLVKLATGNLDIPDLTVDMSAIGRRGANGSLERTTVLLRRSRLSSISVN